MFRILSPSLRNVPFTGLEWSFKYMDEGYNYDGMLIENEPDEEKLVSAGT